ncbi:helix-turn-helix transcriptional regulator [Haloarchaeobius sp. HRN-SO-5]|uniref:helix-turn-helix transcriptional regulator n=1 Tax=Haloarchaeobius sp. HRN-SO-5 TaxID=3446118 RepID=UPI003EBA1F0B
MDGPTKRVEFVYGSAARRQVLGALADSSRSRQAVVASASASESAVYDAMKRLEDRGLVYEGDDGMWAVTGTGRAVADLLDRVGTVESVVEDSAAYLDSHDLGVVPAAQRCELHRLEGCEVVDSPETDPFRAARRVRRAIDSADRVSVVAPVYDDRLAEALVDGDATDRRLVLTPELLDEPPDVDDGDAGTDEDVLLDRVDVRVAASSLAMTVTGGGVYLSLPLLDGSYDPSTELVAESPAAAAWGESVFETFWRKGTPVDDLAPYRP